MADICQDKRYFELDFAISFFVSKSFFCRELKKKQKSVMKREYNFFQSESTSSALNFLIISFTNEVHLFSENGLRILLNWHGRGKQMN